MIRQRENDPMSKRPPCNGYHDYSKLCPKFSKFSVDSEITGLPQNLLSIKAFVGPPSSRHDGVNGQFCCLCSRI